MGKRQSYNTAKYHHHQKKRRVSEPESLAEVEQDEKGAKDWPNVNKAYYESIGLEYKPEHENPFRFQYTDCLWYRARPLREREIILAEDEKNPIGFAGTEEEKCLDEFALVLTDTIGTRQARPTRGHVSTICPGQIVWLRRLQRCMLGHEKLALQGFGEDDIDVRNYDVVDDSRRGALAGDMFNLGSVAQVMHCVLATIPLSSGKS